MASRNQKMQSTHTQAVCILSDYYTKLNWDKFKTKKREVASLLDNVIS